MPDDPVDEAIEESFPASDAPEWTGMHAGGPATRPGAQSTPPAVASMKTVRVELPVDQAVDRIERALATAGMKVFARIDQAAEAKAAGLALRPTVLVLFGNPRSGTPLMAARPTVAIELPLKALVWEDERGARWLSYNMPRLYVDRHGLAPELASQLAPAGDLLERAVRGS